MTGFWKHYFHNSNCNSSSCQSEPEPEPKRWSQGVHVRKYDNASNEVEVVLLEDSDQANPNIIDGWLDGLLDNHNMQNIPQLTRADVIAVSFPEMTGSIGANAFKVCTDLTSVSFPAMTTGSIGDAAFKDCTALTSVIFPAMTTGSIKYGVFQGCKSLTSVSFPKMEGIIGDYAFRGCYRLGESDPGKTVIFAGTQRFINSATWFNVGTSGGRALPRVVNNRLQFQNGRSGIPED